MQVTVSPSTIKGTITAPASKSIMQRACAAALLRKGTTVLHNPGVSADDEAALNIIQQLGANVRKENDTVIIESNGLNPVGNEINCGESGLSSRMFTSIAALSANPLTITGNGSLMKRPFHFFSEVLPQLGVQCRSDNGFLPIEISGGLQPKDIFIDGSLSSQYLTGLLFAYSASSIKDVRIHVKGLKSKPYIDLTLGVMQNFGLHWPVNFDYETFYFPDLPLPPQQPSPFNFYVDGDWSGAAFLLVAGAIAGEVSVKGLEGHLIQADTAILTALKKAGVSFDTEKFAEENTLKLQKTSLHSFEFDATDCPDLFPPLVALAAYCNGTSVIEGVYRLTHKESNRAITLQEEFGKMGVEIVLQDNLMLIKGGGKIKGATVHSHHDHRIAMACAVAALGAEGATTIEEAEAVNKSYPQFWEHLRYLTPS